MLLGLTPRRSNAFRLRGRRGSGQLEAFGVADGNVVQHDGRESGEQGMEAVRGRRVRRVFARGLSSGRGGGLGGFDRLGALRPGDLRIVLVEQDRESFSHVPFGVDEDRPHPQPPGLDLPEGLLDPVPDPRIEASLGDLEVVHQVL